MKRFYPFVVQIEVAAYLHCVGRNFRLSNCASVNLFVKNVTSFFRAASYGQKKGSGNVQNVMGV